MLIKIKTKRCPDRNGSLFRHVQLRREYDLNCTLWQTASSQLLPHLVSAALHDPDPLISISRQLLKHVCRAISKQSVDEDVLKARIISVLILTTHRSVWPASAQQTPVHHMTCAWQWQTPYTKREGVLMRMTLRVRVNPINYKTKPV